MRYSAEDVNHSTERTNLLKSFIQISPKIENCGHCPNHEAPTAVAQIVNRWIGSKDRSRNMLSLLDGEKQIIEEPWATTHVSEVSEDNISLSLMDKIITTFV